MQVRFELVQKEISFSELKMADLHLDALYKGGASGNVSDDPISKLMMYENQEGFRIVGRRKTEEYKFSVLYSTLDGSDWSDSIDLERRVFVFFGDNNEPGHELPATHKVGNKMSTILDCISNLYCQVSIIGKEEV